MAKIVEKEIEKMFEEFWSLNKLLTILCKCSSNGYSISRNYKNAAEIKSRFQLR